MVTASTWVAAYLTRIEEGHAELTDLDRRAGDGDFGTNLLGAARRTRAALHAGTPAFRALSEAFDDAGGTSGPLLGMWFHAFARALDEPITSAALSQAATNGLASIQAAAGARVGDNTMVDAMAPAAEALATPHPTADAALAAAAAAAHDGATSTIDLLGSKGRSSYVGEHARGVMDPGALAIAWFFEAATAQSETA